MKLHAARIPNAILMIAAVGLSLGILASDVPASHTRNALLSVNLFVWFLFVGTYPFAVLKSGYVTGLQPGPFCHRDWQPARFWVGLIATTLFWATVLVVIYLYSVMAWHRGA